MTLASGTRLGPYEIVESLGAGGMGEVYRAHDPRLRRDVALKVILEAGESPSRDRLKRFEDEARAVAALSHPNVLTVFDVGSDDGRPYVVFELLEGESLREALRGGALPQRRAIDLGVQACRGLEAAHARNLIHRDLKPENLFITSTGLLKILDFGLAKLVRGDAGPVQIGEAEGSEIRTETAPGTILGTVGYLSPEQVRGQEADARSDLFALGAVLYEMLTGKRAFSGPSAADTLSAILREEPPPLATGSGPLPVALDRVVRRCLSKKPEERFHSAHDVALSLEVVREAPTPARGAAVVEVEEERSPYPGLRSFTEEDASRFFGREGEVETLWQRMKTHRLQGVIGPSGAGKTSFVRAGVVASRPSGWGVIVSTPGRHPFRTLGQALAPELASDPAALKKLLSFEDPETALELMVRWRRRHGEALLIVDQFEELFTQSDPEMQATFADFLGRLSRDGDVRILLSLRDDFLMRCGDHEALAKVFTELTPLLPLGRESLRRALVEPAKREGHAFEDDALVDEIIESVEGARGALPLLAFAVARLWEKRDRDKKLLTRAAYEEIGGVAGALAQHAEQTLERIGAERQPIVREVFRNLVTAEGTRAAAEREELLSIFGDQRDAADEVLEKLIDARLLSLYELPLADDESGERRPRHRLEIVHESLLKAWPRLVRWQAQDEEGAVLRDQLKQSARLWKEKGRPDDLLWTGTSEREFELWRDRYPGKLTALEEEYSSAMVSRARRRRWWRGAAVASIVAVSLAVAALVTVSRQHAVEQARRAEAAQLLALAEARLEDDPTEALAYATASLELADTEGGRVFAVRALADSPPALELSTEGISARVPVFSPDGRWLAAAGHGEEAGAWAEEGTGPLRLGGLTPSNDCSNAPMWPSPTLLVTGLDCGLGRQVHVWSLPGGERLATIDLSAPSGWSVGPDRLFAETADDTGRILQLRSWELPDAELELLGRVRVEELGATSIQGRGWGAFEPGGGGWLYARGKDIVRQPLPVDRAGGGRVSRHPADVVALMASRRATQGVISTDQSGEIHLYPAIPGPGGAVVLRRPPGAPDVSFPAASGRWVGALTGTPTEARLWDTEAPPAARPLRLRRRGSWYLAAWDVDPSGDWAVVSTQGWRALTFWPLHQSRPAVIDGYGQSMRPLAFSPDSRVLASWWSDGDLRVWQIPGSIAPEVRRLPFPEEARGVAEISFAPDGRFLLATGRQVHVVPLDATPPQRLEGFPAEMSVSAALSPSGRRVVAAAAYGSGPKRIRLWDLQNGETRVFDSPAPGSAEAQEHSVESGYESGAWSVAFAGEEDIYTAGHGGLWRWDLETGAHEQVLVTDPEVGVAAKLSSDGQTALLRHHPIASPFKCDLFELLHTASGSAEPLTSFGCPALDAFALDPSGTVAVTGDVDGVMRVGRLSDGEPHLLLGHKGAIDRVAIAPDLRWVASSGEDDTLRLWPMPDLDKPPLHTLPHDALLAKLKSLTNLRAVRSSESATGWTIALETFPGWKEVPTW